MVRFLEHHRPRPRAAGRAVAALAVLIVLSGCAATPEPEPTTASSSAGPAPSASPGTTPVPEPTTVDPEASAEANLPVFRGVVEDVWGSGDRAAGRAYIDALVTAGFDKTQMELTPDTSTVGNPAESIQFSVRWGDDCLIGQVGPATGEPLSTVVPVLVEGRCLVGETRPIDW
ncbi:hypothetical protein Q9S36_15340 [Microbacterium sp. ARD31]|uniref:DUF6993 domain-containing protein n=1 Tax=Microbacterium sp. ARD31 TaxID=2962576 RepID=UPI0028820B4B|nr:hypothetical protein [Microbacterium sp. ARD31]MDT0181551.1 hypothetical protein [Microbacterium sp. ARD31]